MNSFIKIEPQKLQDTNGEALTESKIHKMFICKHLFLVQFRVLGLWWQKNDFFNFTQQTNIILC